jgi:hypothetical protein
MVPRPIARASRHVKRTPGVVWLGVAIVLLSLLTLEGQAHADIAGPERVCDTDGKSCTRCWNPSRGTEEQYNAYGECRKAATSQGLVEACSDGNHSGDAVYFCPAGVPVGVKVIGGEQGRGCGACTTPGSSTHRATATSVAMILVGLTLLGSRRRSMR